MNQEYKLKPTVSILETTQKIPTLSRFDNSECRGSFVKSTVLMEIDNLGGEHGIIQETRKRLGISNKLLRLYW